jgi:hypothetical protein
MTQPWKFANHPHGDVWFRYFQAAHAHKEITKDDIERSINGGYARPDIMDGNRPFWKHVRRRLGRVTGTTKAAKKTLRFAGKRREAIRERAAMPVLRRLIEGRRVLVLASGPSARDLPEVPADMLVFACNLSPRALLQPPNHGRRIDLYISNVSSHRLYGTSLTDLLRQVTIRYFLSCDLTWARSLPGAENRRILQDRATGADASLLHRLGFSQDPAVRDIPKRTETPRVSTGVALLQYALWYGAAEISLSGLDLDGGSYAHQPGSVPPIYAEKHAAIDHAVIHICARQYSHISCASPESPLAAIFGYRALA